MAYISKNFKSLTEFQKTEMEDREKYGIDPHKVYTAHATRGRNFDDLQPGEYRENYTNYARDCGHPLVDIPVGVNYITGHCVDCTSKLKDKSELKTYQLSDKEFIVRATEMVKIPKLVYPE